MNRVSSMMRDKNLPHDLQTKVKKYLEFVWKEEQKEDPEHEALIMAKLSSELRDEIFLNTNVKYLQAIPIMKIFSHTIEFPCDYFLLQNKIFLTLYKKLF